MIVSRSINSLRRTLVHVSKGTKSMGWMVQKLNSRKPAIPPPRLPDWAACDEAGCLRSSAGMSMAIASRRCWSKSMTFGILARNAGAAYISIRYMATGLESRRPAQMLTDTAISAYIQMLGLMNVATVRMNQAVRRVRKSSAAMKRRQAGRASWKTAIAITRTTIRDLMLLRFTGDIWSLHPSGSHQAVITQAPRQALQTAIRMLRLRGEFLEGLTLTTAGEGSGRGEWPFLPHICEPPLRHAPGMEALGVVETLQAKQGGPFHAELQRQMLPLLVPVTDPLLRVEVATPHLHGQRRPDDGFDVHCPGYAISAQRRNQLVEPSETETAV